MSHSPSQPYRPSVSFITLVDEVTSHPYFPVIIKKVFDVCGSNAFEGSRVLPRLLELERDAAALQRFAESHGPSATEQRRGRMDVFMSVVLAALNRANVVSSEKLQDLHYTIATCRSALNNAWTDPRFVGATDKHRIGGTQGTHPIPQTEDIRRPDTTRQESEIMQRPEGMQRLSGIRKPVSATRKPLSDKARATLEKWFQEHMEDPYPSKEQKKELATICAISVSSVNHWFGNKRMRIKRKVLQVKSQGDEHITEQVLAPRSKWNKVVMSQMTSSAGRKILEDATGVSIPLRESLASEEEQPSVQIQERVGPSGPGRPEQNAQHTG